MGYFVYILYSNSINKYYVGHTDDLERRLHEHNTGQTRYTSSRGNRWTLVYQEAYDSRALAMKRRESSGGGARIPDLSIMSAAL